MINKIHIPVLKAEVLKALNVKSDGIYVDGTAGFGGHAKAIYEKLSKNGKLILIDQDLDAFEYLSNQFKNKKNVFIFHDNFDQIKKIATKLEIKNIDGILLDLGISSYLIDQLKRGFSYYKDCPLDMRMDQTKKIDAKYVVNNFSQKELILIFKKYGKISHPELTVSKLVKYREKEPITHSSQLVKIIQSSVSKKEIAHHKHIEKKYFQALRIYINRELEHLENILKIAPSLLNKDGRMVILSFHSLEDNIIKNYFQKLTNKKLPKEIPIIDEKPEFKLYSKKPISPSLEEIQTNSRSHSAKLRAIIKF